MLWKKKRLSECTLKFQYIKTILLTVNVFINFWEMYDYFSSNNTYLIRQTKGSGI